MLFGHLIPMESMWVLLSVTKGKCISPATSMFDSLKRKEKVYFILYSLKEASLGKLCIKLAEQCAEVSPAMACTVI